MNVAMPAGLAPGLVVGGDFRIERRLSAGGMGAVFVAVQLSTGKQRALKVMHAELVTDAALRQRFTREARVGSMIASDHVVEVIGAGVDEEHGLPWIAMELLQGQNLGEYLGDRGKLRPREVRNVMMQLCHAIAAAHRACVVHRDLKPENVFVAASRSATTPTTIKVLDFGIAKVVAHAKSAATATVGSPAWMAPEQTAAGARIDPCADVWALGLLAFWMLTGRMYWRQAEDRDASMQALLREMLIDPLVAASERARAYDPRLTLPPGFDGWFSQAVNREPEERFSDAGALWSALERVLGTEGDRVSVPPPSVGGEDEHDRTRPLGSGAALLAGPRDGGASRPSEAPTSDRNRADRDESSGDAAAPLHRLAATEPMAPAALSLTTEPTVTERVLLATRAAGLPRRSTRTTLVAAVALCSALALTLWLAREGVEHESGRNAARAAEAAAQPAPPSGLPASGGVTAAPTNSSADHPSAERGSATAGAHAIRARRPVASASAAAAGRHTPPAATAGSGATRASATTSASVPVPSAAPADSDSTNERYATPPPTLPPFNRANAIAALERRGRIAQLICSGQRGPATIHLAVTFAPNGSVGRVVVAETGPTSSPGIYCVQSHFWSLRVDPFTGPPQTIGVAVALRSAVP